MDVTEIILLAIFLLASVASAVFLPWLKSKIGNENLVEFLKWVEIGVAAAEQLFSSFDGPKKKAYVVQFLEDKGITFDEDEVDAAIEAAVNRLHAELYGKNTEGTEQYD